jgi:hypothetical protein
MDQLASIQERLYNDILDLRSIERLVTSKLFRTAWDSVGDEERKSVVYHIDMKDQRSIKLWIRKHNQNTLSVRELKDIAYQLGIYRYSRLSKNELVQAIMEKENENGRINGNGGACNGDSTQGRPDASDAGKAL